MMRPGYTAIATFIVLVTLFIIVSAIVREYQPIIESYVAFGGPLGQLFFMALMAAFVILFIPLDLVLLLPLGVAAWGWVTAAALSIVGWTLGAAGAFYIARIFGASAIVRFVPLTRVRKIEAQLPPTQTFWLLVLLRMSLPVDVLSYTLGMVSTIQPARYILATMVGVAPFGFLFAYAGTLEPHYQAAIFILSFGSAALILYHLTRRHLIRKGKEQS